MPVIKDMNLIGTLSEETLSHVYLLHGAETYTLLGCMNMLVNQAVPKSAQSFNLNRFDKEPYELQDVLDATQTMPMLSDRRAVLLLDPPASLLTGKPVKALEKLLLNPVDTTVLILVFTQEALTKKAGFKTLCRAAAKTGDVVECGIKSPNELTKILTSRAAREHVTLSYDNATFLVERCGRALTSLTQELHKLCAYVKQGEITREAICELTTPTLESSSFDLARAVLRRDGEKVFSTLESLYIQKFDELQIMGALSLCFIDLYRAKCLQMSGAKEAALFQAYSYKGKEFRLRNAAKDATRFSYPQVKNCIRILKDADLQMKSTRMDNHIILEVALSQMLLQGKDRGR